MGGFEGQILTQILLVQSANPVVQVVWHILVVFSPTSPKTVHATVTQKLTLFTQVSMSISKIPHRTFQWILLARLVVRVTILIIFTGQSTGSVSAND